MDPSSKKDSTSVTSEASTNDSSEKVSEKTTETEKVQETEKTTETEVATDTVTLFKAPDGRMLPLEDDCPWDGEWHYWHWVPSFGDSKGIVYMNTYVGHMDIYDYPDGNLLETVTDASISYNSTMNRWTIASEDASGTEKDFIEIYYNDTIAYVDMMTAMVE